MADPHSRSIVVTIAPGTSFQYKYLSTINGTTTFEADPNRSYTVSATCGNLVCHDTYQNPPAAVTTTTTTTPSASATASGCPITFDLTRTTLYGETILLSGNLPQLGNFDLSKAVALSSSAYTASNPLWFITINTIPAGTSFQYKYVSAYNSSSTFEAGNNRVATIPSSCAATTENDSWQYAVTTTSSTASSSATSSGCPVTFDLLKQTAFGENIVLTGNVPQLGNWDPNAGVSLNSSAYSSSNPLWYQTVYLTAGTTVTYKYVSTQNSTNTFEADPNRSLTVPSNCSPLTERDSWQYPTTTTSSSTACATPSLTAITFYVTKTTVYGENLVLVGNISQLGSWTVNNGVPMNSSQYSSSNPVWYATVNIPVGTSFQYKYVSTANSTSTYEADPNRVYTAPGNCAGAVTLRDVYQYPVTTTSS